MPTLASMYNALPHRLKEVGFTNHLEDHTNFPMEEQLPRKIPWLTVTWVGAAPLYT